MKISIRTSKGWTEVENKSDVVCDHCGEKLFSAPHGKAYCNNCTIEGKAVITKISSLNLREIEGEQYIKIRTLDRLIKRYILEGKDLTDLQSRIIVELI